MKTMPKMNYFKVTAHRAHQGGNRAATITFYLIAENALYACEAARSFPGVKHGRPVINCIPISLEEYQEGRKISAYRKAF